MKIQRVQVVPAAQLRREPREQRKQDKKRRGFADQLEESRRKLLERGALAEA